MCIDSDGALKKVYLTKMLDSLLDDNEHHGTPFSREKLQEAISRVMEYNVNNVTMDTFVHLQCRYKYT